MMDNHIPKMRIEVPTLAELKEKIKAEIVFGLAVQEVLRKELRKLLKQLSKF